MTEISIRSHRVGDPPIEFVPPTGVVVHVPDRLTFAVLESGMESGEPSVMILGVSPEGIGTALETSLDKLLAAAVGLRGMAEAQFGWEQPTGHATLMPSATIREARHHVRSSPDDVALADECTDRHCAEPHAIVVWRIE